MLLILSSNMHSSENATKIFEKFIDNPNNDIINMGFVEKEVIYFLNDWKNEFVTNY